MVRLAAEAGADEVVASLLWDAGTSGIAEVDGVLLAGFDDREAAEAVAARAAGWPATVLGVEPNRWTGTEEVTTVTVSAGGTGRVLSLVAGPTFGHGGHPTTALALQLVTTAVDERISAGGIPSVLDVGTGSGVLAIAAASVGAHPVLGIDIDPEAVVWAEANAARNEVEINVVAGDGAAVGAAPGRAGIDGFDVVVANVLAPVQRDLAAAMAAVLGDGGSLITSGYLIADGPAMIDLHRAALDDAGFRVRPSSTETVQGAWAAHRFDLDRRPVPGQSSIGPTDSVGPEDPGCS